MKKNLHHIILGMSLFVFISCAKEVSQDDLIKEAVDIKLQQWKEAQLKTCKDNAMVKAEDYVDSFLVAISLETKLDTIPKPEKPVKPPKPPFKEKPDSVIVSPIYKKD